MDNKSGVTSSAKAVENEKAAKQRKELAAAEAAAEKRKQKALDARKENAAKIKPATSNKKPNAGILDDLVDDKTAMAGLSYLGKFVKKSMRKNSQTTLLVLAFVVALAVVVGIFVGPTLKDMLNGKEEPPPITVINELTDADKAKLLKDKEIQIKNVVLGEARQRKELLVLERDIQVESVWESTWGGLEIFKKAKKIISFGTGYFNIDLGGIADGNIKVDHEKKVVTILVPHSKLNSISIDEGKTQYEDTQKGLLSFGELKLTLEQQGLLKKSVEDSMRVELLKPEMLTQADSVGKLMVGEIYQPLVSAISAEYYVDVDFVADSCEAVSTAASSSQAALN